LSFYGFKTKEASSGIEALEIFNNQKGNPKIDLIFMDILMENLDGLETIKILRENENDSKLPIIAVSANVFEEDKQQAFLCGADDFLPKPVEEKDILIVLEKYLNVELEYEEEIKEDKVKIDISQEMKNLTKEFFEKLNELILLMDNEAILILIKEEKLSKDLEKYIEDLVTEFKYQELIGFIENNKSLN
jgi:CheY-like chemotaxis protein